MPLYEFECPHGHRFEEVCGLLDGEPPGSLTCGRCGAVAPRRQVHIFRHVGPVFSDMDRYNEALLTPNQRRAGVEFRSGREIAEWEEAHGLHRLEGGTTAARLAREEQLEDSFELDRASQEGGMEARADAILESTVKADTGWDDTTYHRWKDMSDAAERHTPDLP